MRAAVATAAVAIGLLVAAGAGVMLARRAAGPGGVYDPLERARALGKRVENREATVPAACYTKTDGAANPCWTCHTQGVGLNRVQDAHLQSEYAFAEFALTNRWSNLFVDRSAAMARLSDQEILAYLRESNYEPLQRALRGRTDYSGYVPDLDLAAGFDTEGFARDGSGWRAVRYKPFPGAFWPTNGSTDDLYIRLPAAFRSDAQGKASREIYRANLAILEAAIAANPDVRTSRELRREVEPIDEVAAGLDLDGDGKLAQGVTELRGLPAHYAGAASGFPVRRYFYPLGTELLHSVRYIDPDQPSLLSARMKELRYSRKAEDVDDATTISAYAAEAEEKESGRPPEFPGDAEVGLINNFGWQLQGFIEDAHGRLRLQTVEEHLACMGCHSGIGATVDQTFAFPRKVPGAAGWRPQDLRGLQDVPQAGHAEPEALTYFRRVGGGDEFRSNAELLARFFPGGALDEAAVRRAAVGGDRDLAWLLAPSRERALQLDKAYRALVLEQRFHYGRDTVISPPANVLKTVSNESTGLKAAGRVYEDGRLHLSWSPGVRAAAR